MLRYLATVAFIFAVVVGGILVERLYWRFAARNPELGPFRPPGKQDCCACTAGSGCAEASTCTVDNRAEGGIRQP